ncbi:AMP-binding protein [Phenylobacterium sp.]|uniref:AMP-binding protein n=1 Tax=Phenylobacterium sp. TaxID=1871053 RepID=UPI00301DBC42
MPQSRSAPDVHGVGSLGDLIRLATLRFADREAVVCGEDRFTYRAFAEATGRVVAVFKAAGLRRGDGLAMIAANGPEVLFVMAAAHAMGLRYSALHPMGSLADHAFILEDAEIAALVVDAEAHAQRGRELKHGAGAALRCVFAIGPADFAPDLHRAMADAGPSPLEVEASEADIWSVMYTGGTTGRPKGVVHSHRTAVVGALLQLAEWEWPAECRFLAATPVSHVAAGMLPPTLLRGGAFHMMRAFDPEAFLAAIEREAITATFLVPTMLYRLLDHPRLRDFDLSSLQMVIYGAAPMSPARLQAALDVFGPVFCQLYAQSECPCSITYLRKGDHAPARAHRLASCGQPVAGVNLRLLDPQGRSVAPGDVGEICVRGPTVMQGYWRRPEETAEALREGWLHTGDLARQDEDGFLYIVDRAKDMVISGGFNVYPREVEDALMAHEAVAAAAVIGVPDAVWGEAVRALVVLRSGHEVDADGLRAFVRERKGPVACPKEVEFVSGLPTTSVGKIDKKAIRARFWADASRQVS